MSIIVVKHEVTWFPAGLRLVIYCITVSVLKCKREVSNQDLAFAKLNQWEFYSSIQMYSTRKLCHGA